MKRIMILFLAVIALAACDSKKNEYDPFKIQGKKADTTKKVDPKAAFEVEFKETETNLKTIHLKLNNSGHDVIVDTGCSGLSISALELTQLVKEGTLTQADRRPDIKVSFADGRSVMVPNYNIKQITITDTQGKPHTLSDVEASVEDNPRAAILVGNSVLDKIANKSYTFDLRKKVIRFE
ncbi:MAG: retroviral-like aspartic protease family protein [Sodaliphilus sp.]